MNENHPNNHDTPKLSGSQKSESGTKSMWDKYSEKIIAGAIAMSLLGVTAWAVGYFSSKIGNIERNIATHHGPQWEKLDNVVAVKELEEKVTRLDQELNSKFQQMERNHGKLLLHLNAIALWIEQSDNYIEERLNLKHTAYAHLTNRIPRNEDSAALNTAHARGTQYQRGDTLSIVELDSGASRSATIYISSAYTDLDSTDVLLQLGQKPARAIGLSEGLGKIKISVERERPDHGDPKRRKTLREIQSELGVSANLE